ncbi:MAG: suppressor of fused domain protein [Planctomycetaceae bacterium]
MTEFPRRDILTAIEEGHFSEFVQLVAQEDATATEAPNEYGDNFYGSYLHWCADANQVEMARHLISLGADVNFYAGLRYKKTPMVRAVSIGSLEMAKLLRESGGTFDVTGPLLHNPIFHAIKHGHSHVVEWLIEAGLDPHLTYRTFYGQLENAYAWAKEFHRDEIISQLESYGCRMPVEGVDIPIWEPPPEQMLQPPTVADELTTYMMFRFGEVDEEALQELVPVIDGMSVAIHVIQPNEEHPYLVLFTTGMSDRAMTVPVGQEDWQYAELVMHLPPEWKYSSDTISEPTWNWPAMLLRKLAYAPHLNETWLGLPSTIVSNGDPPEPLGPNIQQTCSLLVPDFANLSPPVELNDGRIVHFWTVVPLFTAERDYEQQHGTIQFLEQFVSNRVPMVYDPKRPSFA